MRSREHRTIRGPTPQKNAIDRAGNAIDGERHRGGSGTNQPGRVTSFLVPGLSVGRRGVCVKVARCVGARDRACAQGAGVAGNRTGIDARAATHAHSRRESGTKRDA